VRIAYHDQLDELTRRLTDLTAVICDLMQQASSALLNGNTALADQVIARRAPLDRRRDDIDTLAFRLMAQQQPVATDLRLLISSIHINADLERLGALALHIARIAARTPNLCETAEVQQILRRAADTAAAISGDTVDLLATRDLAIIDRIDHAEAAMDRIPAELFALVLAPTSKHGVQAAVALTQAGRYYERYADHAVNIADSVRFVVVGPPERDRRPT
jgi:phosphate transport system protein